MDQGQDNELPEYPGPVGEVNEEVADGGQDYAPSLGQLFSTLGDYHLGNFQNSRGSPQRIRNSRSKTQAAGAAGLCLSPFRDSKCNQS